MKPMMQPPMDDDQDAPGGQPEPGEGTPQEEQQDSNEVNSNLPGLGPDDLKKAYQFVVTAALNMIFGDKGWPGIITKLASSKPNVAQAIGHTTAMVLMAIVGGAKKAGKAIPPQVIIPAGREIVTSLTQAAVGLKLITIQQMPLIAKQAAVYAVQAWANQMHSTGQVTPQMQQASMQRLQSQGVQLPQQQQPPQPAPQGVVGNAMQGAQ